MKGVVYLQQRLIFGRPVLLAVLVAVLLVPSLPVISADSTTGASSSDTSLGMMLAMENAAALVKPALVRIFVVSADYDRGREIKIESSGSGVIISKEGYVVTNHHVAGDAKRLMCTLGDRSQVEADLVGTDPLSDIAVIKLRGNIEYPAARFGDSAKLKVGERVLAMGSPLALSQSVTTGIISNTEMIMPEFFWPMRMELDGEDVGSMVRWIGHDAQIFPGNSGGPLVSLNGEIVGINEISFGLAGAIPGNLAKSVAEQLIKNNRVVRSWIGLDVQPLLNGMKDRQGVLISGTAEGSPAATAGFKAGDILVKLAGRNVSAKFPEELPVFNQTVAALPVGQEVDAVILRDGKEMTLKVTTQEREKAEDRDREFKLLGICATSISSEMSREMKRKSRDGVLVTSIRPGGPCEDAKPAIKENDIIVEVVGKPVKDMKDLADITEQITKDKTEPVPSLVVFERKSERYLTVVHIGEREELDPGLEVRKAWLPSATQVLTSDIAEALGIPGKTGVRITQVYPGTTAEAAGLKVGDILTTLDGETIPASQPEDVEVLPTMIRQYDIGAKVKFDVIRDGKESKVEVELASSPKLAREMKKYHDLNFDFSVRDIGFMDKVKDELEQNTEGAYVESVEEGGWAALARLAVGDVILMVDSTPIPNMDTLEAKMKDIAAAKPETVVFRVLRGAHQMFIEIRPSWSGVKN